LGRGRIRGRALRIDGQMRQRRLRPSPAAMMICLNGRRRCVTGGKYARHAGRTLGSTTISPYFDSSTVRAATRCSVRGRSARTRQPVRLRASGAGRAIAVAQPGDLVAVTGDLVVARSCGRPRSAGSSICSPARRPPSTGRRTRSASRARRRGEVDRRLDARVAAAITATFCPCKAARRSAGSRPRPCSGIPARPAR